MPETEYHSPDSKTIQAFFDSIHARYDFLNTFMSFSLDRYWRSRLTQLSVGGRESSILDIGVGTGESLSAFLRKKSFRRAVGCDFSRGMLAVAQKKVQVAELICSDMHELSFVDDSFDLVTCSFVLRSVTQMDRFLSEVKRVLASEGRFAFLELTRPSNVLFWNLLYRPYLNFYIPAVARLFSDRPQAYNFLTQSVQRFVEPTELVHQMERAGFSSVEALPLTGGMATVFLGNR